MQISLNGEVPEKFQSDFPEIKKGSLEAYALHLIDKNDPQQLEKFFLYGGPKAVDAFQRVGKKAILKSASTEKGELKNLGKKFETLKHSSGLMEVSSKSKAVHDFAVKKILTDANEQDMAYFLLGGGKVGEVVDAFKEKENTSIDDLKHLASLRSVKKESNSHSLIGKFKNAFNFGGVSKAQNAIDADLKGRFKKSDFSTITDKKIAPIVSKFFSRSSSVKKGTSYVLIENAIKSDNMELLKTVLQEKGKCWYAEQGQKLIQWSINEGKPEIFGLVVDADPSLLQFKDENGENLLHYAVRNGNSEIIHAIVDKDNKIARSKPRTAEFRALRVKPDSTGKTPFALAVELGKNEACYALPLNQYDLTYKDTAGNNLFHLAVQRGDQNLLNRFLQEDKGFAGVDPNHFRQFDQKNNEGQTSLMLAAKRGDLEMYNLLRDAGADKQAVDYQGKSVLDYAKEGSFMKEDG